MNILLSYPLTLKTPLYPKTPPLVIQTLRSMEQGDHANVSMITFSSHSGTHLDAPRHFCKTGKTIADCLTFCTTFFNAYCIDVPILKSEEIFVSDLEKHIPLISNAEIVLIRTGWSIIRTEDPERYCGDHPWISSEIPAFLRENCPKLRFFGIDQISVSSILHREMGHDCHRNFLCNKRPILILEDIDLSDIRIQGAFMMHLYPFLIDDIDAVPVIAIAEIN